MNVNSSIYDVLIITETWLCDSINNCELTLSNFKIFRADRNVNTSIKARGGGVLILVNKNIESSLSLIGNNVESLFIRISINNLNFIIGGIYIPPNSSISTYEFFCDDMERIYDRHPNDSYIIAGDFNLPSIN